MVSIKSFIGQSDFDDTLTALLGEAFDAACHDLHDEGQPPVVYELMAKRIIEAVKRGERDIHKLREAALAGVRNAE